jgi:hypothetical protein
MMKSQRIKNGTEDEGGMLVFLRDGTRPGPSSVNG